MNILIFLLFFLSISPVFSDSLSSPPETWNVSPSITHKTEIKFLIPDLSQLPEPWMTALKTGEPHQDISKRGVVIQQYIAVTNKNICRIFRELQAAAITFGTDRQMSDFLFPGKTKEIRLMRKSIKEGNQIKTLYQIGLQASGDISTDKIETSPYLTEVQRQAIKRLFDSLQPEVNYTIRKLYFECLARDQNNDPMIADDGSIRTLEIDIFLNTLEGKTTPFFIDAEVKFREKERSKALNAAKALQKNLAKHPAFFGVDITHQQSLKARNLAIGTLPSSVQALFEKQALSNTLIMNEIRQEYQQWADPDLIRLAFEESAFHHQVLSQRVLLNAEAFGFGPSAAIAEFFPYLRDRVSSLAYIGSGHTLDLQNKLPYDKIFDLESVDKSQRQEYFNAIAKEYDVFLTASDFDMADLAKQAGLTVIIYDPLTWYWKRLPAPIQHSDFYIAQNFFGVAERLKCESDQFPEFIIVPPIVSGIFNQETSNTLLVNMGGLSNPYLDNADLQAFASVIFNAVYEVLQPQFQDVYFVTSKKIAENSDGPYPVTTMLPSQIQEILSKSRLAIMTSGLGNIYEASTMQKTILWLPPANDSQGQQITLLQQHHMIDFSLDWHHLLEDEAPIDYFAPQTEVLQRIAICMKKLATDQRAQDKLKFTLKQLNLNGTQQPSSLSKLTKTYEVDGAKQVAESLLQWLGALNSYKTDF